jgi:hypothetical protein
LSGNTCGAKEKPATASQRHSEQTDDETSCGRFFLKLCDSVAISCVSPDLMNATYFADCRVESQQLFRAACQNSCEGIQAESGKI